MFKLRMKAAIKWSSPTAPSTNWISANATLSVVATDLNTGLFPISYQWQLNGTNIPGATASSYTFTILGINFLTGQPFYIYPIQEGNFTLIVTDAAGSTNITWDIRVLLPGRVAAWGADPNGECDRPITLTNAIALAAGEFHSVAVLDGGSVVQWGYNWGSVPTSLTNAMAVAAGYSHTLALRSDGTITAWGNNSYGQTNVPINATNAIAVAAGGQQSLALLKN